MFSVSGRPNFVEKIANLVDFSEMTPVDIENSDDEYPKIYRDEIIKAQRRVPNWFRKIYQNNSKILTIFLKVSNCNETSVYPSVIERNCDLSSATFYVNFNDMKGMYKNGHGKVFQENPDGTISLWEPVAEFILQEYNKSRF